MKDWLKVEAVLFGSGKYLTEDELVGLSGVPKKSLKHALSELKKHYDNIDSSLHIFNEGNSWKLNVRDEFAGIVRNVISEAEMPKAIMETLALISYKSPVLQSEIIDSRGTGAYEHIALLEDKGFISREKSGRSFKLRTAPKFFDYFEVAGDAKLRQMFKNVKKPENLGNLEVYTAKTDAEKEVEFSENIVERMKKVETTPSDHEEREKFLDNFENKYSKAKANIDEADSEMNEFRRIAPHEEKPQTGNADDPENVLKKFDDEIAKLDAISVKEEEEEPEAEPEEKEENAEEEKEEEESKEEKKPALPKKEIPEKAAEQSKASPEKIQKIKEGEIKKINTKVQIQEEKEEKKHESKKSVVHEKHSVKPIHKPEEKKRK